MNFHRSINRHRLLRGSTWVALFAVAAMLGAGCHSSSSGTSTSKSLSGTVAGPSGVAVVGATVFLVPASAVPTEEITGAGILARTTEGFDEPLEDVVATMGASFTQAVTDAAGKYRITSVPAGSYFVYVQPAGADTEHFPGGSLCRVAVTEAALRGTTQDITLSSSPSDVAVFVGMSTCLTCHAEYDTEKMLAHRLGFRVPGVDSGLQDSSERPEIEEGLSYFLEAANYLGGTPVYHYDRDVARGFDDFKTSLTDPSGSGGVVYAILWLWRDTGTGEYKITFDNVGNDGEPNDGLTRVVQLTYGGVVEKQRFMIDWDGRNGLYPILQYQHSGDDSRYDRTRQQFRDYHLDFYWDNNGTVADPSDDLIVDPDITKNISRNCLGCHATGYTQYTDGVTGEVLCDSREDLNGEYDIDGDNDLNDLNTGCEVCHGAGSEHIVAAAARYIVSPEYLSPSREVQLCGRCHDRQAGADPIGGDHPLNAASEFPPAGISRGEYLDDYVSRAGPKESSYWADFAHSKSHHQQTPDFVRSSHYRNDNQLVVCSDCHDMHGGTGFPRGLIADPDAPDSPLCITCHGDDIGGTLAHTTAVLGVGHGPATVSCSDCHMVKTAKTGAGRYGYLLSPPTGTAADVTETYFENDISSHVFDVPGKENVGVRGVLPASAMPIPYTQSCGICHDPSNLQYD